MIIKFMLPHGWAYHETDKIVVEDTTVEQARGITDALHYFPEYLNPDVQLKLCHIRTPSGSLEVAAFNEYAYLCADNGDTIQRI